MFLRVFCVFCHFLLFLTFFFHEKPCHTKLGSLRNHLTRSAELSNHRFAATEKIYVLHFIAAMIATANVIN